MQNMYKQSFSRPGPKTDRDIIRVYGVIQTPPLQSIVLAQSIITGAKKDIIVDQDRLGENAGIFQDERAIGSVFRAELFDSSNGLFAQKISPTESSQKMVTDFLLVGREVCLNTLIGSPVFMHPRFIRSSKDEGLSCFNLIEERESQRPKRFQQAKALCVRSAPILKEFPCDDDIIAFHDALVAALALSDFPSISAVSRTHGRICTFWICGLLNEEMEGPACLTNEAIEKAIEEHALLLSDHLL